MSYAGDISCTDCFAVLQDDASAQLIDVRTMPEWNFVGLPNLESLEKRVMTVEWQQFPTMQVNESFTDQIVANLTRVDLGKDVPLFCLCRSGVRSISAAQALTQAGYSNVYNVLGGFEGDRNSSGQRGQVSGWKYEELPWVQG